MIKLVIFDLDMTLIDTLKRFHRMFNIALKNFGAREVEWRDFIKDYKKMMSLGGFSLKGIFLLLKYYPAKIHKHEFWLYFRKLWNLKGMDEEDRLIEGAKETLMFLKERGIKVGIITGRITKPENIKEELKKFGIEKYVDFIYTFSENFEKGGKRSTLIKKAMEEYGVRPEETICVGDQIPDMRSGEEAGVITVGVLTGLVDEGILKKNGASIVIRSVKELPAIIEKIEKMDQRVLK